MAVEAAGIQAAVGLDADMPSTEKKLTELIDKDTSTAMPLGPNPPSQPLATPYYYATYGVDEKTPLDTQNIDPEPAQPSVKGVKEGFWRPHYSFSLRYIIFALFMTVWPWGFYKVIRHKDGITLDPAAANVVLKNPQDTEFVVTTLASAMAWLVGHLFSTSVTTLSQKFVVIKETDIFHISFFSALKNRAFVWSPGTLIPRRKSGAKAGFVLTVITYIVAFILVTPGITTLLHPQTFSRLSNVTATEPDFASSNSDCVAWYKTFNHLLNQSCDSWRETTGLVMTTCQAPDQLINALDFGTRNILSLVSNTTESYIFPPLGGGIHSVGSLRGVVPIGPNGVPGFTHLFAWPPAASAISYNYTLNLQGFTSNVNCSYSSESIGSFVPDSTGNMIFETACPPEKNIVKPVYQIPPIVARAALGFGACLTSEPTDLQESYEIYLYALPEGVHGNTTGNITCSVTGVQSAVFPVKYGNQTNFFNLEDPLTVSPNLSTALMRNAIVEIANTVWLTQQFKLNAVAGAVEMLGLRIYGLPNLRNDTYPHLYAAMIQGLLDYETTNLRLLFSTEHVTKLAPPSFCKRNITGWVEYSVFGWKAGAKTAIFLIPVTIVNLTSLLFLVYTMMTVKTLPSFDPTDTVQLIVAASGTDLHTAMQPVSDPAVWKYRLEHDQQGRFALLAPESCDGVYGNENTSYVALPADG